SPHPPYAARKSDLVSAPGRQHTGRSGRGCHGATALPAPWEHRMTIGSTASRQTFACNGVSTVFPVPIQAYQATDFTVIRTTAAGTEIPLVLNSDYSLTATGTLSPQAWTLTTLSATPYPGGDSLQIFLNSVQKQQ